MRGSGAGHAVGQLLLLTLDVAGAVAIGVLLVQWMRRRRRMLAWADFWDSGAYPERLRKAGGL